MLPKLTLIITALTGKISMELVRPIQQLDIHVQSIMVLSVQGRVMAILAECQQRASSHQSAITANYSEYTIS